VVRLRHLEDWFRTSVLDLAVEGGGSGFAAIIDGSGSREGGAPEEGDTAQAKKGKRVVQGFPWGIGVADRWKAAGPWKAGEGIREGDRSAGRLSTALGIPLESDQGCAWVRGAGFHSLPPPPRLLLTVFG
jgi:hypothetical protein